MQSSRCSFCNSSHGVRGIALVPHVELPPLPSSDRRVSSAHTGAMPGCSTRDQSQIRRSAHCGRAAPQLEIDARQSPRATNRRANRAANPRRPVAAPTQSIAICYQARELGHTECIAVRCCRILILLAASVFVVAGVRKLALPAILGYLAVGMLLGPHALALVVDNDTTRLLADFGVVFLVFTLGLEFSLPRLLAMRWRGARRGRRAGARDHGDRRRGRGGWLPRDRTDRRRGHRRRGRDVLDRHHHLPADRAVREQPHSRPPRRGDLPVSGPELPLVSRPVVAAAAGGRRGRTPAAAAQIAAAIGIAAAALLLVLAAGRWLLRPLFIVIAGVRSAELFSLAVLLAVLASAWATRPPGCRSPSAPSSPA